MKGIWWGQSWWCLIWWMVNGEWRLGQLWMENWWMGNGEWRTGEWSMVNGENSIILLLLNYYANSFSTLSVIHYHLLIIHFRCSFKFIAFASFWSRLYRDQNSDCVGTEPKEAAYAATGENADKGSETQMDDCQIISLLAYWMVNGGLVNSQWWMVKTRTFYSFWFKMQIRPAPFQFSVIHLTFNIAHSQLTIHNSPFTPFI